MTDHAAPARVHAGSFLTLHYRLAGPQGDVINTFDDKPATLSLGAESRKEQWEQSAGEAMSYAGTGAQGGYDLALALLDSE